MINYDIVEYHNSSIKMYSNYLHANFIYDIIIYNKVQSKEETRCKRKIIDGITLISLVITIVVMLILVAVTVRASAESGLFGHAKNAVIQYKDEQEKESNIINNSYIEELL